MTSPHDAPPPSPGEPRPPRIVALTDAAALGWNAGKLPTTGDVIVFTHLAEFRNRGRFLISSGPPLWNLGDLTFPPAVKSADELPPDESFHTETRS